MRPRPDRAARGVAAEDAALHFLQTRGLKLLHRNFRARNGELDLVMNDRGTLAVIEVRARQSDRHGGAAASVTASKQQRIVRATQLLLAQQPSLAALPVRFDVVTFDGDDRPDWLQGVFDASDD